MKRSFFQAAVISILLFGCSAWTLTKRMEKKIDGNYTRVLQAILNTSRRQHRTKPQLYGHQPPITKTIQVKRNRHGGHCWRSRDELISDVFLWTPSHGRAKAGQPARTYIQQLCEDTGCSPEDLPEAMNDKERWQERVMDIRADGTTRWWWWRSDRRDIETWWALVSLNIHCKNISYIWCETLSSRIIMIIIYMKPYIPEMTLTDPMSRKEGESGLASIEDSVDASIRRVDDIEKRN